MESTATIPLESKKVITPAEHIFNFIEKSNSAEYQQGYFSSLRKIKRKITEFSTVEDIKKICEDRKNDIYKRIDSRTSGDPMERRDEMSKYEKGTLYGADSVLNFLLKFPQAGK